MARTRHRSMPEDAVIFTSPNVLQSCLELDFLFHEIFTDIKVTLDVHEALSARCVVYLEYDFNLALVQSIKSEQKRLVLMHLGDETAIKDLTAYNLADVVLRNYYHEHIFRNPAWASKIHWMPNGYRNGLGQGAREPKPASERKQLARFIGWLANPKSVDNEREGFALAATRCEPMLHCVATQGFAGGFSPHLYKHLMEESIFAPCPAGNAPETIRLFDVLECGCIPITRPLEFMKSSEAMGNGPFAFLNDWGQLVDLLSAYQTISERESEFHKTQKAVNRFWKATKLMHAELAHRSVS
ncbi:MAG: hypothetical protein EB072_14075 [Betaproteobacteria bacterium]|nr:hypothetical protein [Betaproteobacteria bacterium]